jgi:5-methylcytosine-specific restriction endonuclease McrA
MSNPWFRFYSEVLNDIKVQSLDPFTFKMWVNILCLASKNDGRVPDIDNVAWALRVTLHEINPVFEHLKNVGLIDPVDGEINSYKIHAWEKRQYVSDTSKKRVAEYRKRRKNAGLSQQMYLSKKDKDGLYDSYNNQCFYCESKQSLTIDHKIPITRGGDDQISNLQIVCRTCNASKADMTHDEFMAWPGRVTLLTPLQKRPQNRTEQNQTRPESETDRECGAAKSPPPPRTHAIRIQDWIKILQKDDPSIGIRCCPDELGEWAQNEYNWDNNFIVQEWGSFCDYWSASNRDDAKKMDWTAAWRRWCEKTIKDQSREGAKKWA